MLNVWIGYIPFGWELVAEIYEHSSLQSGNFLPSLVTEHFSVKTLSKWRYDGLNILLMWQLNISDLVSFTEKLLKLLLPILHVFETFLLNSYINTNLTDETAKSNGSGGIRTHASEETGALNQRLRPLGHATHTAPPPYNDRSTFVFISYLCGIIETHSRQRFYHSVSTCNMMYLYTKYSWNVAFPPCTF